MLRILLSPLIILIALLIVVGYRYNECLTGYMEFGSYNKLICNCKLINIGTSKDLLDCISDKE